ncbi:hypothetical protein CHL76_11695 [Marinococcus halophilus]|uniref:DUF3870 domain-containing protein n=1 Tax=Marinococcus halophilus TaxID=1371 RepID=A0A510Y9L2_MARHA|nr:DUF3870 domain-containing protein [Marinococcus halophilus]OZT79574.1 hypothetical protein CHL76_11695 [Marinococcus halophilus]GEK60070.1 hypothetical protein MHA01_29750 [Marinococcus halophilus]
MDNVVFIAGHARLPEGMAAQSMFQTLTVTVEIDREYGVILESSCTLATAHGREFINRLLKGYSLRNGIEKPINLIEHNYSGKAKNAIISALKDLYKQYKNL